MRSISPARLLLPAARSLAEGSWLALLYAALQAIGGEVAHMGPIELGAVVVAGTGLGPTAALDGRRPPRRSGCRCSRWRPACSAGC